MATSHPSPEELLAEIAGLRVRLEEAEDTLRAIREGEVDALLVSGPAGEQIYTLKGADYSYRILIEAINEGTATLAPDGDILYANRQLAEILGTPLERLIGTRICNYVEAADREYFMALLEQGRQGASKGEVSLRNRYGVIVPVFLSFRSFNLEEAPGAVCLVVTDLTEQERQEAILTEEQLSRAIFEQAEAVILVVDPEGRIIRASQEAYQICRSDLLLRQFDEVFRLATLDTSGKKAGPAASRPFSISPILQGRIYHGLEVSFSPPDGREPLEMLLNAGPLQGSQGEVLGAVVALTDITARKQAEREIQRLASFPQMNPHPVLGMDIDGRITFHNQAALEALGKTAQAADLSNFLPGDLQEILAKAQQTGEKHFQREVVVNGAIFLESIYFVEQLNELRLYTIDITERKRAEKERQRLLDQVEEERDKLEALVESITDEIWYCDAAGNLRPMNLAAAEAFAGNWHEEYSQSIRDFIPGLESHTADGRPRPPEDAPLLRSLRGETIKELEEIIYPKTGQPRYRLVSTAPIRDRGGRVVGAVGVGRDITAPKEAEEALRDSERRFRQVVESIPQLVWTCRFEGPCDFLSRKWIEYTGIPEAEQLEYGWLNQIHPDDLESLMQAWKTATVAGGGFNGEFRIRRHDGVYRWFDTRAVPWTDAQGQIVKWFGTNTDTTERKAAEEALRESEARERARASELQAIFDAVPTPIFLCHDPDGRYITGNPAAYELLRLPPGRNVSRAAPEDERPNYRAIKDGRELTLQELPAQSAITGQIVRDLEYDLVLEDGTIRHVSANARPLWDEAGRVRGAVAAFMDLTQRQQAEEALRESEERLRLAQSATQIGVWEWRPEEQELDWTPEMDELYGLQPGTVRKYQDWTRLLHPEDLPRVEAESMEAIVQHRSFNLEFRILHASGETRWIQARGGAIYDEGGRPSRVLGVNIDITRRKLLEQALRESREDLNRAQAVAHTGSWRLNVQKNELTWSDENHRIFGIPPETPMTYETFLGTVHPEDREYVDRKWMAALRGEPYDIEHRIIVDGTVRWVRERAGLEFDSEGQLLGGFGTTQDITGRKQAEAVLKRAHDELEQKVKDRTAELRHMVTQLQEEVARRQQTEESLQESEGRLRHLASQLLTIQEKERGRLALELHDDLGQSLTVLKMQLRAIQKKAPPESSETRESLENTFTFIDEVIDRVRRLSRNLRPAILDDLGLKAAVKHLFEEFTPRDIQVTMDLDDTKGLFSQEDQLNIYRILQESFSNINKHAQASQVSVRIKRQDGSVAFQLEDNGRGFDYQKVIHENITDRGLGLTAMNERARMLGGSLNIWSEEGQGTKITLIVPIQKK